MAHTKSVGAAKNNRESESQRLGIKRSDGQPVMAGQILVRQRGTKYLPGLNVKRAGDDTLYAMKNGRVKFKSVKKFCFDRSFRYATKVNVL